MINTVENVIGSDWLNSGGGGPSYSAGYQAILDRADNQSFDHPSDAIKAAQNTLYVALDDAGILDLLDILYIFANDQAGGFWKINWINPSSFQMTEPAGAVTKSNPGIKGNGSTTYARTNYTPSSDAINLSGTEFCAGLYLHTVPSTGLYFYGYRDAGVSTQYTYMSYNGAANFNWRNMGVSAGGQYTGGTPDGSYLHTQRNTNNNLFKNASSVAAPGGTFGALPSVVIDVGRAQGGSGGFSNALFSCFYMGANLTPQQITDFKNAFDDYMVFF